MLSRLIKKRDSPIIRCEVREDRFLFRFSAARTFVTAPADEICFYRQETLSVPERLWGLLPITALIVGFSVKINAGAQTKIISLVHGQLTLASNFFPSEFLNLIPLPCPAAFS
jgi:hypothetical protein